MLRLVDLICAILATPLLVARVTAVVAGHRGGAVARRLLVLDASYSLQTLREREQLSALTSRDLDGWFERVWTVHPLVGASPEHEVTTPYGAPIVERLDDRHVVIEAPIGRRASLRRLPLLNFLFAQADLLTRLIRLVRDERVGIVQAGDPYYLGLLGLVVARAAGVPLVVRVAANYDAVYESVGRLAYPRIFRSRWIEKRVDRLVLRRSDLVVPANGDNLDFAVRNGADPQRCLVVPYTTLLHPLHLSDPGARSRPDPPVPLAAERLAVMVSRLEPVKHPEDAVHAIAHIAHEAPELGLVVVGDGSVRAELERLAASLGVADRVWFAGNRPQPWIAALLTHADVVLSPLTGRALVEAALSGTPIVAYDVEWQRELVRDGQTGRLVPYRDHAAMAVSMLALLRDSDSAAELGRNARRHAFETMDPAMVVATQRQAYFNLLGRADGTEKAAA